MKKKVIFLVFLLLLSTGCGRFKEYNKKILINDTNINISIYSTNERKAQQTIKYIQQIYERYNRILTDYNTKEKLTIDKYLKKIISVGNSFQKYDDYIKFNPIIKNNTLNKSDLDISFYINGIVNEEVYEYLKSKGISKFKISSNQFVLTGLPSDKDYYNIAISNPFDNSILKMLKSKGEYIVTKNINDSNFESSNFNKNTKNVSVTVVTNNISTADYIASLLLMMPLPDGKKLAKDYGVEVIWCYTDNNKEKIEYTNGLNAY